MIELKEIALSRLTNQFSESPKIRALVETLVNQFQTVVNDAEELKTKRWIDTAEGVQLDGCGAIVGELRQGKNDEDYREAIKFRIFVNTSNGTAEDLIKGIRLLTFPDDVQYIEQYPATAMIFTNGPIISSGLQETIQDISPVAISDVQILFNYAIGKPFRFAKSQPDSVLRVNTNSRLTANGNRIAISPQTSTATTGPRFSGIAPSYLKVNGSRLALSGGLKLVVNDINTQTIIDSGYHLTGVV